MLEKNIIATRSVLNDWHSKKNFFSEKTWNMFGNVLPAKALEAKSGSEYSEGANSEQV